MESEITLKVGSYLKEKAIIVWDLKFTILCIVENCSGELELSKIKIGRFI